MEKKVKYMMYIYVATGNVYYFKQEWIVEGYWSKLRPITKGTFQKAKREGKPCSEVEIKRQPADVVNLFTWKMTHGKEICVRH